MSIAIQPSTQALEAKSKDLARRLADLKIEDLRGAPPTTLTRTLEDSVMIRNLADDFIKEVESSWGPVVTAAHQAHKKAVAERDRLKAPAERLKEDAGKIGWDCDRELKRRQQEADQVAEYERARLQKIADDEAEAKRKRLQAEADDARLDEALKAAERGDRTLADRLIDAPVEVPVVQAEPVFVPPPPQIAAKVDGASFSVTWDFEITDETLIPRVYLIPNDKAIRQVVIALKDKTNIPGIKAVPKPRTARR